MTDNLHERVAAKLGHPFHGRRKTDVQLARAALEGHLGWRRATKIFVTPSDHGSLTEGLKEKRIPVSRTGVARLWTILAELRQRQRRWRLLRAMQVDQGNTPWCVDATRCHWQLSLPVYGRLTHPIGNLYAECKKIDPWPGQDGTSAEFMLTVCQQMGLVESAWWWYGQQDNDALIRWLVEVGGIWFGAMWPEDAFRTRITDQTTFATDGLIDVSAEAQWLYGHEVFLIGRHRNYQGMGPCLEGVQSWGQDNYGVRGRFWIREQEFFDRWMNPDLGWGDAVGVVEKSA